MHDLRALSVLLHLHLALVEEQVTESPAVLEMNRAARSMRRALAVGTIIWYGFFFLFVAWLAVLVAGFTSSAEHAKTLLPVVFTLLAGMPLFLLGMRWCNRAFERAEERFKVAHAASEEELRVLRQENTTLQAEIDGHKAKIDSYKDPT